MTTQEPSPGPSSEAPLAHPRAHRADDSRQLLYIGAGILALVVVSVAIVLLVGRGSATEFAADSPEGAFQRYLAAFDEADYETAYAHFSQRVQEQMSLDEYRSNAAMFGGGFGPGIPGQSRRVLFEGREEDGDDRVRLELVVEYFFDSSGPFGGGGGSYQEARVVAMVRENGEWRLDEPLMGLDPAPIFPPDF